MRGGSPVRVRYVAEWVEELSVGRELSVGDRVVCPHGEMVVRGSATRRLWRGADTVGEELVVALAPHLVEAGSRWRVRCEFPGRPMRRLSGTEYSAPTLVGLDETLATLDEAFEALGDFAEIRSCLSASHTTYGARVTLSSLEPGEDGLGRSLIRVKVGEDGLQSLEDALERVCVEAERRFRRDARRTPERGVPGARRVRFVAEWVDDPVRQAAFEEGDPVTVPPRGLVVRRLGSEQRIGNATETWWVSTEAEALTHTSGLGLDLPSQWTMRGADVLAELGQGLVEPGAAWGVHGSAHVGCGPQADRAEELDMTLATLDDALDAFVAWAEVLAAWADRPGRVESLTGNVGLNAVEPGRDGGRQLARAGTGVAEGIDAFLTMLEVFCDAIEGRYGSEAASPDPKRAVGGARERT